MGCVDSVCGARQARYVGERVFARRVPERYLLDEGACVWRKTDAWRLGAYVAMDELMVEKEVEKIARGMLWGLIKRFGGLAPSPPKYDVHSVDFSRLNGFRRNELISSYDQNLEQLDEFIAKDVVDTMKKKTEVAHGCHGRIFWIMYPNPAVRDEYMQGFDPKKLTCIEQVREKISNMLSDGVINIFIAEEAEKFIEEAERKCETLDSERDRRKIEAEENIEDNRVKLEKLRDGLRYERTLKLTREKYPTFDFDEVDLSRVETLDLESCGLTKVPDIVRRMRNLKKLVLTGNDLDGLDMVCHSKLEVLHVSRNRISWMERCKLPNLRLLMLDDNKMQKLEWFWGSNSLPELRELCVAQNQIAQANFSCGDKLEALDLTGNQIADVSTLDAPRLSCLVLDNNQLNDVVCPKLANLKCLSVRRNALTRLPVELAGLEELDMMGNKLTEVGDDIQALGKLKKLDVSGNQIGNVSKYLGDLDGLEELNLSDNALTDLPINICCMKKLWKLDVSRNKYLGRGNITKRISFPSNSLRILKMDGCGLTEVPECMLVGKDALYGLSLADNQITTVPQSIESKVRSLRCMNLQGNNIVNAPRFSVINVGGDAGAMIEAYGKNMGAGPAALGGNAEWAN